MTMYLDGVSQAGGLATTDIDTRAELDAILTDANIGRVTQIVSDSTSTEASTTTTIPFDDTTPQNDEGVDCGLSISITPTSASHRFFVLFSAFGAQSATGNVAYTLFDGIGTDAIATQEYESPAATTIVPSAFSHDYLPGNTTARTITVRFGPSGGTAYFLQDNGGGRFGGTNIATLTVIEYLP